jgi:hypothetical protein
MDAELAAVAGTSETARIARAALAEVSPEPGAHKPDPILTAVGVRRNLWRSSADRSLL